MSLPELVIHFNGRFAQEHGFDFRPLLLQRGQVIGLFDEIQLNTQLLPIHHSQHLTSVSGYVAQLCIQPHFYQRQPINMAKLLSSEPVCTEDKIHSITTFDRLCRTVHLLNALELLKKTQHFLLLEVDPGHIIGVQHAHGAYFEEIIVHSGLKTQNIVIAMSLVGVHQEHYSQLLHGLQNYRECGYQIALNLGHLISADKTVSFIKQLAPDYVLLTALNESYPNVRDNVSLINALCNLKDLIHALNGQIILQDVKRAEQELLAIELGFDLVSGDFYNHLSPPNRFDLVEYDDEYGNELEIA